ncbi:hypothetical protein GOODEAATRI_031779 [Goodea atripinnis]|uniref:Uncharacterized protein n=1 Tax=Goodea atripinnis TaxID=208336 RepID=A0ABV0N5U9_9TELE
MKLRLVNHFMAQWFKMILYFKKPHFDITRCRFMCSFVSLSVEDFCELPRLSSSLNQFPTTGFHSAERLVHSWLGNLHDLFAQHHYCSQRSLDSNSVRQTTQATR